MNDTKNTINVGYIDLDEGELMHWKYIKKVKLPNGKWRYYYDMDSLKNDAGNAIGINQKRAYKKAWQNENLANFRLAGAHSYSRGVSKILSRKDLSDGYRRDMLNVQKQSEQNIANRTRAYAYAKAETKKAYDNYIGTPLSFFTNPSEAVKKTINTGKNIVKKYLGTS